MPQIKAFKAAVKAQEPTDDTPKDEGIFEGYAATFDEVPDRDGDIIRKGAFSESLQKYADADQKIPLLVSHETVDPDFHIGYVEAAEDDKGLHVVGHIMLDLPKGQTVYKLLQRGLFTKMSFMYDILESEPVKAADGQKAQELQKLELFECSIVTVPANENATIDTVKAYRHTKAGRRNSKKDENMLKDVLDQLNTLKDGLDKTIQDVTKLIDGEDAPTDTTDTQEGAQGETTADPKAQSEPAKDASDPKQDEDDNVDELKAVLLDLLGLNA